MIPDKFCRDISRSEGLEKGATYYSELTDDVGIHLRKVDSAVVRVAIALSTTYMSEQIWVRRTHGRDGAVGWEDALHAIRMAHS